MSTNPPSDPNAGTSGADSPRADSSRAGSSRAGTSGAPRPRSGTPADQRDERRRQRVVAELGRPETPEETAARKAEDSRKYRMRKTVNNLVFSLLVTVAVVVVIVFAVPRSDKPLHPDIDYSQVAQTTQQSQTQILADPELPDTWSANYAEIRTSKAAGVASWNIGLIAPGNDFIGLTQGFDANPTWVGQQLEQSTATGVTTIDGIEWTVYDNRGSSDDLGNLEYALTTEAGGSTYIIFGTGTDAEFEQVASGITSDIQANAARASATPTPAATTPAS